jgi:hypothetical protein
MRASIDSVVPCRGSCDPTPCCFERHDHGASVQPLSDMVTKSDVTTSIVKRNAAITVLPRSEEFFPQIRRCSGTFKGKPTSTNTTECRDTHRMVEYGQRSEAFFAPTSC